MLDMEKVLQKQVDIANDGDEALLTLIEELIDNLDPDSEDPQGYFVATRIRSEILNIKNQKANAILDLMNI